MALQSSVPKFFKTAGRVCRTQPRRLWSQPGAANPCHRPNTSKPRQMRQTGLFPNIKLTFHNIDPAFPNITEPFRNITKPFPNIVEPSPNLTGHSTILRRPCSIFQNRPQDCGGISQYYGTAPQACETVPQYYGTAAQDCGVPAQYCESAKKDERPVPKVAGCPAMGHGHCRKQGRLRPQYFVAAPETTTLQIFIFGKAGRPVT